MKDRWIDSTVFMSSILEGFQTGQLYSARLRTSVLKRGTMTLALRLEKTESTQEEIFLASSVIFDICFDQVRSSEIVTPRSFTDYRGSWRNN